MAVHKKYFEIENQGGTLFKELIPDFVCCYLNFVTRDIPPYSLVAGNPCRVIRKITEKHHVR